MPIYEYRCSSCGHKLEALQKLADAPLVECPSCDAAALVKLVSAAAFQLKGSGWYATDFKGGSKPAADKPGADAKAAAGAGEATSESKTESKAESAPETKTEPKPAVKSEKSSESSATPGTGGTTS